MVDAASTRPPRSVPVRRMSFEESFASLPRFFAADDDVIMSNLLAWLSGVIPDGEDFFVRSVRRFRSEITDPSLKAEVNGFIGQEAMHGREHRVLNDRLSELGYPTKTIERRVARILAFRERHMSAAANLATTAALEHFTATFAETVLGSEEARRRIGSSAVLDFLLWHSLEESEHKAVAFDLFRHVGGSERTRRWMMNVTTATFLGGMFASVMTSMVRQHRSYSRAELSASVRRFTTNPFINRDFWNRLRDYNRASFHPDDHDTDALVDEWCDHLFGDTGTLHDRRSGAG